MPLFLRFRQHVALAGLLLSMVLVVACNGGSATAEDTATATSGTEAEATSPPPAATNTVASNDGAADETAVVGGTDTPESSAAATASSNQTDGDSLPALEGYMDDRSGPVEVLQSLYSAVNLKQYARAYSYWEPSDQLAPFPEFAEGYAETESVELTTGDVSTDAGAGQLYFQVPVTLDVTTADGGSQTFVGCYVLHLARPEIQAEPPFSPMAIASASISEAAADADTAALMAAGCR